MLKDTEFAFAVARVRSNENKLLSSANIESLINASDYKDCLKILSESGYGDFEKKNEEEVLSDRQREAFELIYDSAPQKQCLDFLIIKNDFHNIKALIKSMVVGSDAANLLVSPSVVEPCEIKKALEEKDYSALDGVISEAVKEGYELITKTMDGQALEVYLDKKCIEASCAVAKKSGDAFSVSLADLMCALADIKIALRCMKTGKDKNFILSALADSDLLDKHELCEAALSGEDELCAYVSHLGFAKLCESIKKGYASFEKISDDMLVERIKDAKYQCLGIAPLVAYYFATDAEVKTVRIILSCKKNGIDVESIKERVRVLYV